MHYEINNTDIYTHTHTHTHACRDKMQKNGDDDRTNYLKSKKKKNALEYY